jgi:hypothetical protein
MLKAVVGFGLLGLVAGCVTEPVVAKQRMTLGEANIEGMECRREKPMGTAQPKTICADPDAWARYDAAARYESELAFQKARTTSNAGAFNRQ